ncbi:MAG: phage replisome organizer N-terminal domain-containing protein [Lachnospiraceae bacterium]|nr:phage replisome organizer N-terminal domain-containing protein [Lachnospiraceae bacterium]
MADNRKYYYLKLKEGFFESDELKILQSMPDGYLYSDILLKLYLRSLRNGGRLMYKDVIPYTSSILATLTGHQVGTVEKAVDTLKQLGLIEILDNGAIYMMDIQNFIGQSSTEADRKRDYRNRIDAEKQALSDNSMGQMSGQMERQMSTNIEDKSTPDIRDRDRDKDKNNRSINTSIAPSSKKQTSEPQETPFITLQLNTGEEHPVYDKEIKDWETLYPAVDVRQQLRSMKGWLLSNKAKRKTKRGINRFINNWLSREQDKGGSRRYMPNANKKDEAGNCSGYENYIDKFLRESGGGIQ